MVQGKISFQKNGNLLKNLVSQNLQHWKNCRNFNNYNQFTGHQCDKTTTMSSLSHHLRWLMAKEMMEKLFATIKKNGFAIFPLVCFISDLLFSWS